MKSRPPNPLSRPLPSRSPTGRQARRTRVADAESYRVSVGSDEAQILRERAAWLQSLDRKYGITR